MPAESDVVERIRRDPTFSAFGKVLGEQDRGHAVRDSTFYLRRDGLLVNAEGWYHPPGKLIGEVLYAPDPGGEKVLFGQTYRKVTLYPGTYDPVPYPARAALLARYDPSLDQTGSNPLFARYKQIFDRSEFVAVFPGASAFVTAMRKAEQAKSRLHKDVESLRQLLGETVEGVQLGFTGTPALGKIEDYHDLDIVFTGTLAQNRRIAERMRELTRGDTSRRCFEGGKAWSIRFYNDHRSLMCCFFSYREVEEAPLHNFKVYLCECEVNVEGTIIEDSHSIYMPTLLELADVELRRVRTGERACMEGGLTVVVYHTASRGDCYCGDRVRVRGSLVNIEATGRTPFPAVCIIDREGLRNLTPPWAGYYEDQQA